MRIFIYFIIINLFISCTQLLTVSDTITSTTGSESSKLTTQEVVKGLKEALKKGCDQAVFEGSKEGGFYKNPLLFIPFPEEAIKVKEFAVTAGMSSQVDKFESNMNKAAEEASSMALDVLVNAVLDMSIQDGWTILKGEDNAATQYLKEKTYTSLEEKFTPIAKEAMDKVEVTRYWNPLASAYNKTTFFTGEKSVDPDLEKYVTDKTLDGLFLLISKEEKEIRDNPLARTTDILKRVFAQQ